MKINLDFRDYFGDNNPHAIRPDNRMDQTLFVRPVALQGVGSAMLHQRFISRASDVMRNCQSDRMTFAYMMRNARNGFIKIGISNNPKYREQTLQAEEPEIELIWSFWTFAAYEKWAHEMVKEKRLRGEWFNLTPKEIAMVKSMYECDMNLEKFKDVMASYGFPCN